ncbi:lantibiotic immunity ABC transporter MutG family permease subunit [Clostridioides difficile]|uniref:lantibiotic immunity ABC transporter MutG family permease subunit n=1 Tax=unclassified Clostridioides TaxID=2635829 RepID=UPI00142F683F|nr:lantibiotic immunity ABC transporter MutG family permease subunit [Clostridioides difficile]MDI0265578.1 lantibiotic immunity ABC transporter MutG family permease subunit [Clostridioides difficile]NJI78976.1 lantibiotic immunity ABC transporter MutG family permease subunit [Clostridioides difficile]NJJ34818.1 lantibiotic immunity ABC transporter MutG family permease subunit [Clostridioides difficile]NJK13676.1 lantibiotic immunity ABC transporter MutG family permease subunit [Clostridioides 
MEQLVRIFFSDLIKLKRTFIILMHFCIALIGMGLCLGYYKYSSADDISKIAAYLQVIAIAFPLLSSIMCSLCIEQEYYSGSYKHMLTSSNPKYLTLISKYIILICLGFGATLVSVLGFKFGVSSISNEVYFTLDFYVISILILVGSNLFVYILHLFLSLRFGKGASIGVGIVETLLSAVLLTGLGARIWPYIPCVWGVRFISIWSSFSSSKTIEYIKVESFKEYQSIGLVCGFVTILAFIILCIWFSKWEGKKSEE